MLLNETVAAIAEAIREKTGKSDLIAPVDFAEEIKGITAGGGSGESGGGDWHYFDISGLTNMQKLNVVTVAMLVKLEEGAIPGASGRYIAPSGVFGVITDYQDKWPAFACDYSVEVEVNGMKMTIGDSVTSAPWYDQAPEITKEEFYALTR